MFETGGFISSLVLCILEICKSGMNDPRLSLAAWNSEGVNDLGSELGGFGAGPLLGIDELSCERGGVKRFLIGTRDGSAWLDTT